jgi:catechol 2,3-dioxygenase-like lactoylglutathione lyase family enzyme
MSFAHLTLATRDVVGSRDFFAGTLGWEPITRPGNIDFEAAWLRIAPGRQCAVEYPAEGFAGLKERLAKRGAELIDPIRDTPFERFFFRDPNGYVFEVVDADRTPEV